MFMPFAREAIEGREWVVDKVHNSAVGRERRRRADWPGWAVRGTEPVTVHTLPFRTALNGRLASMTFFSYTSIRTASAGVP
jgi:hypothetical protein